MLNFVSRVVTSKLETLRLRIKKMTLLNQLKLGLQIKLKSSRIKLSRITIYLKPNFLLGILRKSIKQKKPTQMLKKIKIM